MLELRSLPCPGCKTGSVTDLRELPNQLKGRNIWLVAEVIRGCGASFMIIRNERLLR